MNQELTPDELSRDLEADLVLCEAAAKGPWVIDEANELVSISGEESLLPNGTPIFEPDFKLELWWIGGERKNYDFIAAARTGWPIAIKRAMMWEDAARALSLAYEIRGAALDEAHRQLDQRFEDWKALRAENDALRNEVAELRDAVAQLER